MGSIERAKTMQRRHNRNVPGRGKSPQISRRITLDDAASDVQERPLTPAEHIVEGSTLRFGHAPAVNLLHPFAVSTQFQHAFAFEHALPVLNVFWNVEN